MVAPDLVTVFSSVKSCSPSGVVYEMTLVEGDLGDHINITERLRAILLA